MKKTKTKAIIDIPSMLLILAAIITGFILHKDVWHQDYYPITSLCWSHVAIGLVLIALLTAHCVQHSFWFKNFEKIPVNRKRVTTLLLIVGIIVAISGIILVTVGVSETVSHIHYIMGILFTVMALCHVLKRWKIFRSLF